MSQGRAGRRNWAGIALFLLGTLAILWVLFVLLGAETLWGAGAVSLTSVGFSYFLAQRARVTTVSVVAVIAIPTGCLYSSAIMVTMLSAQSDPAALPSALAAALAIAAAGGVISAIAYLLSDERDLESFYPLSTRDFLRLAVGFSFVFISYLVFSLGEIGLLVLFFDPLPFLISVAFLACGFGTSLLSKKPLSAVLPTASSFAALFGAALAVVNYMVVSLRGDLSGVGPTMALGLLSLVYGTFAYIVSIFYASTERSIAASSLYGTNWHLVEAYTFLVFLLFAPPSIFELFNS
jgi:hypothetical protein